MLRKSALADSLLERMCQWPTGMPPDAAGHRMMNVFLDEIRGAPIAPLHLTMPRHPRLLAMAATIAHNPADETDLDAWAHHWAGRAAA